MPAAKTVAVPGQQTPPVSTQLANMLLSGRPGLQLLRELRARFPGIGREEAFLGIVIAWTIRESDLVELELELSIVRAQLAKATVAETAKRAA
jgi:hypothetical protein